MSHRQIISTTASVFGFAFASSILMDYLFFKREMDESDMEKGGIHLCRYEPAGVIFMAIVRGLIAGSIAFAYLHTTNTSVSKGDILDFKFRMGI